MRLRIRLAAIAAAALAVAGAGSGYAASQSAAAAVPAVSHQLNRVQLDAATVTSLPGSVRAVCVNPSNGDVAWFEISNVPHQCADNLLTITWGTQGPAGPAGPQGPAGASGANGASAVVQVVASTSFTSWPEGGGWGTDSFSRLLSESVQQVNSSHCAGAPVCYEVFGTLTDSSGSTVPVNGHASPNGSSSATITAANIKHIAESGQATFQFYATSNKVSASNVPATANGSQKSATFNTTDWGEQAFPAGTRFFSVSLTQYDWLYTATVAYMSGQTSVGCTQTWNDQINPGDDGQGAADGNITGVCPV